MLKLCLGFLVDTLFCVKTIHADILVLVSEFLMVAILSEWWSVPTTVGTFQDTLLCLNASYYTYMVREI